MSSTNIFKDKQFPRGKLSEYEVAEVAGDDRRYAMRTDDARLPGQRNNHKASVENVQRPRFGKLMD